jgi:hypothetical protein
LAELLPQHADFLLEIVDRVALLLIDPRVPARALMAPKTKRPFDARRVNFHTSRSDGYAKGLDVKSYRPLLIRADARAIPLRTRSVQCVVTSPPYWGLRDYGARGQIGLEPTPALYVASLLTVFAEVWRVLKDDGTLWLNLGDSYSRLSPHGNNDDPNYSSGLHGAKRGTSVP